MKQLKTRAVVCIGMAAITIASMAVAAWIERGFGSVEVSRVRVPIVTNDGIHTYLSAKLYVPQSASTVSSSPAVLALHGYQNDKDTSAAYALELARRGIVALSRDQFGHDETLLGLRHRGFDTTIGGPDRFKLFMSFSAMNRDGKAGIIDSSMGASAAFRWLAGLDYVDPDRIGLTRHSMGTWSALTAAMENPSHAAVVLQCGEAEGPVLGPGGKPAIRNMLLLQARYDEFDYFRDYKLTVGKLNTTELRYKTFAGQDSPIDWNRTYGEFADGTARRMQLLETVHRGVTLYDLGLSFDAQKTRLDWNILGKTGPIALLMAGYLYTHVAAGYSWGTTDLRFIWPFLRPLTPGRAAQVVLYLPFVAGFGTGWALLGLSLFDGPFMSALVSFVPQFLVLFLVSTYFFRKTGRVNLGSLVTALIVSWITCGGAAFF